MPSQCHQISGAGRACSLSFNRWLDGHKLCLNTLCQALFVFVSLLKYIVISVAYFHPGHKNTTDTTKSKEVEKRTHSQRSSLLEGHHLAGFSHTASGQ